MKKQTSPNKCNIAAVDIGLNAARILIKSVDRTIENGIPSLRMKKLQFIRVPLRLGMDVFNVGTLRLLAKTTSQADLDAMKSEIERICHGFENIRIIGSGGNINKIFRLTPKRERRNHFHISCQL